MISREQMNIVIVGHVDHGKSTVIGRLLADTNSLPEGKLDSIKALCKRTAKPFEYAFLLDALKDEQSQGITIDIARCFFKSEKRDYIILDAPGHIEFLKNMVTGAAHAEAALLVIDAAEGIQENSKRHGFMISMLGIKQVSILVNKMDLVNYSERVFDSIKREYTDFLRQINVKPVSFIPISAFHGDNMIGKSPNTPWFHENSVMEQVDAFKKSESLENKPFRLGVQDIYKFTEQGDDRRIVAGTIETGKVSVGDELIFFPSGKKSKVKSIESFNTKPKLTAMPFEATGLTLETQIYIKPGELAAKTSEPRPHLSDTFKANIFWVGRAPMIKNKTYKLKLGAAKLPVKLIDIVSVLDASELSTVRNKQEIERHDVAECLFETNKPIAFDLVSEIEATSRFVIVDNYEIAGGGIIIESSSSESNSLRNYIKDREKIWERGSVSSEERAREYTHKSKFIVLAGAKGQGKREIAKALERRLFVSGHKAFYLGISNIALGLDADSIDRPNNPDDHIRMVGELARIMTESGQIFITSISNLDDYDLERLKLLNEPYEILVVNVGENNFNKYRVDLELKTGLTKEESVDEIFRLLVTKKILEDYHI